MFWILLKYRLNPQAPVPLLDLVTQDKIPGLKLALPR